MNSKVSKQTEKKGQYRPSRLSKNILARSNPNDLPSWMRFPPCLRIEEEDSEPEIDIDTVVEEYSAQAASVPAVDMPTPTASQEAAHAPSEDAAAAHPEAPDAAGTATSALPAQQDTAPAPTTFPAEQDSEAVDALLQLAGQVQPRDVLRTNTPSSSAMPTPITTVAQPETSSSTLPESPRKAIIKRKRSQADIGRDDSVKRPKTKSTKKPLSKATQENVSGASSVVTKKGKKSQAKEKGRRKAKEVEDTGAGAAGATVASIPYTIPQPGTKVGAGRIRIPAKRTGTVPQ